MALLNSLFARDNKENYAVKQSCKHCEIEQKMRSSKGVDCRYWAHDSAGIYGEL